MPFRVLKQIAQTVDNEADFVAASGTKIIKVHHTSSPAVLHNEEPVRMSMYPGGEPSNDPIAKIEREDWPAPPSPAAILPEICKLHKMSIETKDEDEDENVVEEDPKIKREIEELSKFKDESGIGKIIYKELEEQKIQPKKLLDPWKASRVPGADHEPKYQTRYQSPMFACKLPPLKDILMVQLIN
ncbi:hypothetical protein CHS0354_041223 [Potamilus streckersoni]|uniref:Uncharacterized protein n=1 Tax=Potamilus streckersoni TaxID=2493646 RepID=A0AAE0SDY6_9BIVA|nr:hypothetical protein CHS0354_041223 [Potamilus streckersoni]